MPSFPFELVSPEKLLFTGEVEAVVVPGTEGEFTVLKDHAPVMSVLKPGIVEIEATATATAKTRLFVRGGFADVSPAGLTILAEYAIPLEDLDPAKLDADLKDAEEDVADAKDDEARRLAAEKRDQLKELRVALKL
jgi:F-type H+-transporting ATPase subunit epsilon